MSDLLYQYCYSSYSIVMELMGCLKKTAVSYSLMCVLG